MKNSKIWFKGTRTHYLRSSRGSRSEKLIQNSIAYFMKNSKIWFKGTRTHYLRSSRGSRSEKINTKLDSLFNEEFKNLV